MNCNLLVVSFSLAKIMTWQNLKSYKIIAYFLCVGYAKRIVLKSRLSKGTDKCVGSWLTAFLKGD